MLTEEMGKELAQAMQGALTVIFLLVGALLLLSIVLVIIGCILYRKGKKEENKEKKFYKVGPIFCWIIALILLVYVIAIFV